jgi:hypothetical protein
MPGSLQVSNLKRQGHCLAEIFNDYSSFTPQNVMVQYVSRGNERPAKKQPHEPSSFGWETLANNCYDIEPTNTCRTHIIPTEAWIKETWKDCREYLHQTFIQYNGSGQHDSEMDEWCSQKELERWVRATNYKAPGKFINFSLLSFLFFVVNHFFWRKLCHPFSECHGVFHSNARSVRFESIGRQMPSGTEVDVSLADGTTNTKKSKKRGNYKKKDQQNGNNNDNNNIATVIESISNSESQIAALCILIEFGKKEEKRQALAEVRSLAFAAPVVTTTADNSNEVVEVQSATDPVHDEKDNSTDASL